MAFRPFYEPLRLLGGIVGRDLVGKTEEGAYDWVRANLSPRPEEFYGTKAELEAIISTQADACAVTAKKRGFFVGKNNARALCYNEIKKAYEGVLVDIYAESTEEQMNAKNEARKSAMFLYALIIIVVVVLIIIYRS